MANTPRLGLRLLEATDVANYELINQILNLIDSLVAKQEALAAAGGHAHSGEDGQGPKVPYANLTGAPTALPASGGDAATVGGKAPADFALASHAHAAATTSAAGFLSAADKASLNTLISRVDQALTTVSSPTFNVVTANRVVGAVYA